MIDLRTGSGDTCHAFKMHTIIRLALRTGIGLFLQTTRPQAGCLTSGAERGVAHQPPDVNYSLSLHPAGCIIIFATG